METGGASSPGFPSVFRTDDWDYFVRPFPGGELQVSASREASVRIVTDEGTVAVEAPFDTWGAPSFLAAAARSDGSLVMADSEDVWTAAPPYEKWELVDSAPFGLFRFDVGPERLVRDVGWFEISPDGEALMFHEIHRGRLWTSWLGGEWALVDVSAVTGTLQLGDGQVLLSIVGRTDDVLLLRTYDGWHEVELPPRGNNIGVSPDLQETDER